MTPILVAEGLTKRFGALTAVEDVSLDLRPGEVHALIGPNGAGKTTLMQLLSGLLLPDSGQILFERAEITRASPAARACAGLGRSFQITAVVAGFTAQENAALAAQATTGSSFRFWRAAARDMALTTAAMAALEEVGLAPRAGVRAGDLSHGERRLLELAMVLAARPRALILDEPMAGLGHAEGIALTGLLARLKTRLPLLLVEHDMQAVFALADRVSLLVEGRLVITDTPAAVRADASARAAYLGEDA
ncbi:MAG: ATP-binding cassette domain-containing protein [Pseudomonadota bacterium]